MSDKPLSPDQDNQLTDDIYNQLKYRMEEDPGSVSPDEQTAFLMAAFSKLIRGDEDLEALDVGMSRTVNRAFDKANAIIDSYEAGKFPGDKNRLYDVVRLIASNKLRDVLEKIPSSEAIRLTARWNQVMDRLLAITDPIPDNLPPPRERQPFNHEGFSKVYDQQMKAGVEQNEAILTALFTANPDLCKGRPAVIKKWVKDE